MADLEQWRDVVDALHVLDEERPKVWPGELPPEGEPGFWWDVMRAEQARRDSVSSWLRRRIGGEAPALSALDGFLVKLRIEWACQLVCSYLEKRMPPEVVGQDLLLWLLVETWERDGHEGLWLHAERDGERPGH